MDDKTIVRCPVCKRSPNDPWRTVGKYGIVAACVHAAHNQPPALAIPGYAEWYRKESAELLRSQLRYVEKLVRRGYI